MIILQIIFFMLFALSGFIQCVEDELHLPSITGRRTYHNNGQKGQTFARSETNRLKLPCLCNSSCDRDPKQVKAEKTRLMPIKKNDKLNVNAERLFKAIVCLSSLTNEADKRVREIDIYLNFFKEKMSSKRALSAELEKLAGKFRVVDRGFSKFLEDYRTIQNKWFEMRLDASQRFSW